jgi:glycosyltransferase involved in cell wall biosynthesis
LARVEELICYSAARMSHRRQPVVGFTNWEPDDDNQYLDRLTAALKEAGVPVSPVRLAPVAVAWMFARGMRAIHVHWPEYLVRPFTSTPADAVLNAVRLVRLAAGLCACRLLRIRIVWTVHNLGPHEADASWAAFRAYALVARAADAFVAHSRAAAGRTESRFPRARGRLVVAPHGNYVGAHPGASSSRSEVRARYGVPPDAFLLLAFGQVRRYKRLAELSRAVAAVGGSDLHLLVAGAALEDGLAGELESVSAGGGRVHLDLRRVPGEEVAELYDAADAAVFNHAELFSSGALLLALSQGLPVVTAESDAARELAGWPAVSTFQGSEGLLGSVERLRAVDGASRRSAALDAATAASWERAATTLRDAYAGRG